MDRYELRRQDYSLSDQQRELRGTYAKFFAAQCPLPVVRAAEPLGFAPDLWKRLCANGSAAMAIPESAGGDGADLVDLIVVAEEIGRSLAPVPWIDHVCAARLLARFGALPAGAVTGQRLVALDPQGAVRGSRLVAAGAIADEVVLRDGDEIVRLTHDTPPPPVGNVGRLPMAPIDPAAASTRTVLAAGPAALAEYQRALDEWRLLTAAALVGLIEETMRIAATFATTRYTLGVPISTLQAISHPLADIAVVVHAGRNLVRRAAWFLDNEPDERAELAPAAFVYLSAEAARAATVAVHIQGGLGVSTESAAPAYLVRARGWPLAAGDPGADAVRVAGIVAARAAEPAAILSAR
ncbi:acyl-CoA dehydrogenase [Nocardia aurantia]|uniref:Acyl-CoA dehydrogenase FadE27 n=1 Tax=Nocardia aurantia TaxID=2585199 RepID=A0A7K0E114_9NOCA|nr:acyl-CoA dehydrogenase [Nocardia aurantia]MQY31561.1 Acyl-CoA dehydrogenase FadE27 [Nocardia aurantia]